MASPARNRWIAELFGRPESRRDRRRAARLGVERLEARDVPSGAESGHVFVDLNGDGVRDDNEPGVADVLAEALDNTWAACASDVTDAAGYYLIENVPDDSYNTRFTLPTGSPYVFSSSGSNTMIYPMGVGATVDIPVYARPQVLVATVNHAVEGSTTGTYRFTRTGGTSAALTADYIVQSTGPGYATPGVDYATLSGSVTFPVGASSVNVSVVAFEDNTPDSPELLSAMVSAGVGYDPASPAAHLYILESEPPQLPVVTVSGIADAVEGGAVGVLRFVRSGSTDDALVASYSITSGAGAATPGDDYAALSGWVTFPMGTAVVDVLVTATVDGITEGTETVTAVVQAGSGYEVGEADTGVVRIADIDYPSGVLTGVISGVVWDDTDTNGVRDPFEPRRPDHLVTLHDANGLELFTLLTAQDGSYTFAGLSMGDYTVHFAWPGVDEFTLQDAGYDDAVDSDPNAATGMTATISVTAQAPVHPAVDAGIRAVLPQPMILIADRFGNQTATVKVAKWWYSFDDTGSKAVLHVPDDAGDFIDVNDDRFYVWVRDSVRWSNGDKYITATINTTNVTGAARWNDSATAIPLARVPATGGGSKAGWYVSDSQFAVSNAVDDGHNDSRVGPDDVDVSLAQNAPKYVKKGFVYPLSDRTHKIALEGTVTALYDSGNPAVGLSGVIAASASVPVQKVVKLHIAVLQMLIEDGTNRASHSQADVEEDVNVAREVYAQVGIKIALVGLKHNVSPPNDVRLVVNRNGLEHGTSTDEGYQIPSDEAMALFDDTSLWAEVPSGVIHIYYVNFIEPASVRGASFHYESLAGGYVQYDGSIMIGRLEQDGGKPRKGMILAHEVGHILDTRDPFVDGKITDHFPYDAINGYSREFNAINLMAPGEPLSTYTLSIFDQVRLTREQEQHFYTSRPDYATNP